jgi:hypothetical protein
MDDELHIRGENANVIHALLRKRRDLSFQIAEIEKQAETARADLIHVDAVIRMFAPDIAPDALPERQRHVRRLNYFAHGEISRRALNMLRAGGTVTTLDIANRAMEEKELPLGDRRIRTEFCRRINMQLNAMRRERKVERIGEGRAARWRLASEA